MNQEDIITEQVEEKTTLLINNKYCQLKTNNVKLFAKIRNLLSYKEEGVQYTEAYRSGWSGVNYLISKAGVFYTGLLPKVKDYLLNNNYPYSEINNSEKFIFNEELDLTDKFVKYNIVPREHQLDVLNVVVKNDRGIVRSCTGSGKTQMVAMCAAKFNAPTIVYVIGLDLLDQFYKLFSKLFDEEIGYIGDGICNIKRINIASIWTIGRALKIPDKDMVTDDELSSDEKDISLSQRDSILKMLSDTKVHFFDESHVISTKTATQIYKSINPIKIFGFSGTPFRDDSSNLLINAILGEQIINVSASSLIEKGFLAQPIIKFVTVPKMTVGGQYLSVYKDYIVENEIRNNLIVDNVKSLIDKKYTPLVLCKQIKHLNLINEKILAAGMRSAMLYGNDSIDKRNEVKQMLINKEIDVIVASTVFDIGLNLEEISALVLAGSGKSSIRALQRVGRALRMIPGKKYAAIIDFFDQAKFVKKHSMIRYKVYCSEPGFKVIKSKEMK